MRTLDLKPWPFAERPRVLIEHPDPDARLEIAVALRDAGCTVAMCTGPESEGSPATRCPVHKLEPCAIVDGADVVLTGLAFDEDDGRNVLQGLRARYPSTPLVVEATVIDALELKDLLEGCTVIPQDAEPSHVVNAVLAALPA
jgi:CheY-like chemotaxis protein